MAGFADGLMGLCFGTAQIVGTFLLRSSLAFHHAGCHYFHPLRQSERAQTAFQTGKPLAYPG
jgi:hypothetical protein